MTRDEIERAEQLAPEIRGIDAINLDGFSVDPEEYAALERTLDKLALYCEAKRKAMQARLAGDIEVALSYERRLETIYKRLPAWARW